MEKTVTSTELQKHTRDLIDEARTQGLTIVIETYGKPIAVLLPFEEYAQYLAYKAQRESRRERFAAVRRLAEEVAGVAPLSDAEADTLIEAARTEVYRAQNTPSSDT